METKKTKNQKNNDEALKSWAKYSGLAFQMGAIIFIGIFGGFKLDQLFNLRFPVFVLTLSILSVFAAIYYAVKDLLKK